MWRRVVQQITSLRGQALRTSSCSNSNTSIACHVIHDTLKREPSAEIFTKEYYTSATHAGTLSPPLGSFTKKSRESRTPSICAHSCSYFPVSCDVDSRHRLPPLKYPSLPRLIFPTVHPLLMIWFSVFVSYTHRTFLIITNPSSSLSHLSTLTHIHIVVPINLYAIRFVSLSFATSATLYIGDINITPLIPKSQTVVISVWLALSRMTGDSPPRVTCGTPSLHPLTLYGKQDVVRRTL